MPRKPYDPDPSWIVWKRRRLARRVRSILYAVPEAPLFGVDSESGFNRRETSWAWLMREYVRTRAFRYSEILNMAREYAGLHGAAKCSSMEEDLELMKSFEGMLKERRRVEERWKKHAVHQDPVEMFRLQMETEAKSLLLMGVCPVDGEDLPCGICGRKAVEIDGLGGIREVA